jgi:hypothetical protein
MLARLDGYLCFDRHFPSLIISYLPANDFYYSGPIGSITIYLSELIAQKNIYLTYIGTTTKLQIKIKRKFNGRKHFPTYKSKSKQL